jgi:hypothetical protein
MPRNGMNSFYDKRLAILAFHFPGSRLLLVLVYQIGRTKLVRFYEAPQFSDRIMTDASQREFPGGGQVGVVRDRHAEGSRPDRHPGAEHSSTCAKKTDCDSSAVADPSTVGPNGPPSLTAPVHVVFFQHGLHA